MKTLIDQAYKMGMKILTLTVFASNKRAYHIYQKVGFEETGRIPQGIHRKGRYIDNIIMTKKLA